MKKIFATAFMTSLISYGIFALAEYTRPGFVSYHFSLHWFLLLCLVFGVLWAMNIDENHESKISSLASIVAKLLLSVLLFALLWKEGTVFNDLRIFLALVASLLPWMLSFDSEANDEEYE